MILSFSAHCPDSLCQRLPSSSIRLSCLLEPIVKQCQDHVCITTRRVVLLTFMSHRFSQIKKSVAAQVHYKRHTFSCLSFQVFRSFFNFFELCKWLSDIYTYNTKYVYIIHTQYKKKQFFRHTYYI